MVSNDPASAERTRHLTHIHGTDGYQYANAAATDEPSHMEHCKRCRSALERTTENAQSCAELDISLPTERIASPHHEQRAHSASGTEEAIGRRDGSRGAASVAGLTLLWEVEVEVPSRLADC